jgi:hypothetical protein
MLLKIVLFILGIFVLFSLFGLFACQPKIDPVYISNLYGESICEFAENGTIDEKVSSFVQDGKLYFLSLAIPAGGGNLGKDFEFILSEKHETLGKYKGKQKDTVEPETFVFAAGFAEAGKITITDVFFDDETLKTWSTNVKLATIEKASNTGLSERWGKELFSPIVGE